MVEVRRGGVPWLGSGRKEGRGRIERIREGKTEGDGEQNL